MCSFCNQNKITGQAYQPTPLDVEQTLGKAASDLGNMAMATQLLVYLLKSHTLKYLDAAQDVVKLLTTD